MYLKPSDLVAHVIILAIKHQLSRPEPEPWKKQWEAKSLGQKGGEFKALVACKEGHKKQARKTNSTSRVQGITKNPNQTKQKAWGVVSLLKLEENSTEQF